MSMIFRNRIDAAKFLIPFLEKYRGQEVIVLAIPRGGVPMGQVIAEHFSWPLNLLLSKKIGHPMNREFAIGAVTQDGIVLDSNHPDVPESYIAEETKRIQKLLDQRRIAFMGSSKLPDLKGKIVVIVDDGIATGFTMRASIELMKKKHPQKIVVAVPVASPRIIKTIEKMADEVIVMDTPVEFMGVGQFYEDFAEVTDDEVIQCLHQHKADT